MQLDASAFKKAQPELAAEFGQCSMLYQEIAKHVFGERDSAFFCTDRDDPDEDERLQSPLGEWP